MYTITGTDKNIDSGREGRKITEVSEIKIFKKETRKKIKRLP